MAGAGQPWYMPLTWPIGHVASAVSKPEKEEVSKPAAAADLDLVGHATSAVAATRSGLLAAAVIFWMGDGHGGPYPAFGSAKVWAWWWVWPMVVRNVAATWAICGFWDWFLNYSPLAPKLRKFKLNPEYPPFAQIRHDAIASTVASITGAAIEALICHLMATGAFACDAELGAHPYRNLALLLATTHLRVPHFWLVHRSMHPWRPSGALAWLPDGGKFLYRHVHSMHHKSYNPTAFAGTNMHPVESTAYYSAAFVPLLVGGAHPLLPLACIFDCAVGAWLGHDGFQWPGSGDYFHQLHHAHFECNYGAMHFPMDKWLGTFAEDKEGVKQIIAGGKAAKKA